MVHDVSILSFIDPSWRYHTESAIYAARSEWLGWLSFQNQSILLFHLHVRGKRERGIVIIAQSCLTAFCDDPAKGLLDHGLGPWVIALRMGRHQHASLLKDLVELLQINQVQAAPQRCQFFCNRRGMLFHALQGNVFLGIDKWTGSDLVSRVTVLSHIVTNEHIWTIEEQ